MSAIQQGRLDLKHYGFLLLFSLLVFVPGISTLPVIDRDEAHFAQASRQMLQTGNYFQIRFQDGTRFQKPPGINWLQAASVSLFSNADSNRIWPYRLPSVLGALLSVLLTAFFAKQFCSRETAIMAAGLLASSLLLVLEAHMAVIDACLLASVILMQGALWLIYDASRKHKKIAQGWALGFWLAMAIGFVLKGVSPLFGVLTIATLFATPRIPRRLFLTNLHIFPGFCLFLLLNVLWLFFVNEAEHSNYLLQMLHKDLLPKLQGGHESHGKPPLFHLLTLPLSFWPGSLFLVPTGIYAWKYRNHDSITFLLAWLLPSWIFFEAMPTKLPQYVLPLFPALAILSAMAIDHSVTKPGKTLQLLIWGWLFLSLGIGIALMLLSWFLMAKLLAISFLILSLIGVFTIITRYYVKNGNYSRGLSLLFILSSLIYPLIFHSFLPKLSPLWLSKELRQLLNKKGINDSNPLLVAGFEEPSLVFTFNTKHIAFTSPAQLQTSLQARPKGLALITEEALGALPLGQNLQILAVLKGFNYSKGRWLTVHLVKESTSIHDKPVQTKDRYHAHL